MFFFKEKFPAFYRYQGRKIIKKLSNANLNLLKEYYCRYSIDREIIEIHKSDNRLEKTKFCKNQFEIVNLEIGFGDGEFLIKNAISKPEELFIGSEVYINGISKVLKKIIDYKIKNILLSNLNSFYLLKALPFNSIDNLIIINPDPWIKKKHHKRRLINFENIKLLKDIIKSKNSIFITTDSISYLNDIKNIYLDNKNYLGKINMKILSNKDKYYGISRYQRKAIEKGGKIYQITI